MVQSRRHDEEYGFAWLGAELLVDEQHVEHLGTGTARRHGLRVGELDRPVTAHVHTDDASEGLTHTVRFAWAALDAWFEELLLDRVPLPAQSLGGADPRQRERTRAHAGVELARVVRHLCVTGDAPAGQRACDTDSPRSRLRESV
ncbi:MAG: hypothetical protein H0V13_09620 [Nocardioidaceae bacterium]|nr:hypothetical protein [Nocardioidaceae bacterium]